MFNAAIHLRHELHRYPELSSQEEQTAARLVRYFVPLQPESIIEHLGGYGLAVIFSGKAPGPTILFRSELDSLPLEETIPAAYQSSHPGISHKCGHDGHSAILAAVGSYLASNPPQRGKVVLLFQPAEETGKGAAAVLDDPQFGSIRPDFVFALHNLPGIPLGEVVIRENSMACASRGMGIVLRGLSAHAAQPETGRSPAQALATILGNITRLPESVDSSEEIAFVTTVGATLGEKAFGLAPHRAEIWATLRSEQDATMHRILQHAERVVQDAASQSGLEYSITYEDIFAATSNDPAAVDLVMKAHGDNACTRAPQPFRWSEDFGQFTARFPGALFGIGAGLDVSDLHQPDFDFPDALIPLGAQLFIRLSQICLGREL